MQHKTIVLALVSFATCVGLARAETYISTGTILQDTTWNTDVYILDGTVSVAPGVTLTIQPGSTVLTSDAASTLLVAGKLVSVGTESQMITFSSLYEAPQGNYATGRAITLSDSVGSRIEYTAIENAMYGLSLDGQSTLTIKNNLFQDNYLAITDTFGYQPMDVQNNTFVENHSAFGGIRTLGDSTFRFNDFRNNVNVFEYGYYAGNVDISANNFAGSELVIRAPEIGYGYGTVSMLNNWWGTTDEAAIEGMIYDRNDLGTLQRISYSAASQPIESAGITFSAPVPEPETYAMLLAGLCVVGAAARRRNNRSSKLGNAR